MPADCMQAKYIVIGSLLLKHRLVHGQFGAYSHSLPARTWNAGAVRWNCSTSAAVPECWTHFGNFGAVIPAKNPIIDYVSRLFNVRRSSKCSICGSVCCGRY